MNSCTPSISTNPEEALCHICSKIFKTRSSLNRHIKKIHKIDEPTNNMNQNHIICPLCEQDTNFNSHEKLRKHLQDLHQVSIELITFEFSSKQEYETWKDMQKIETSYVSHRTIRRKEHKIMYYDCNRSDLQGYKPNYKIRTEKAGGSIKIKGVCPSRLICKLRDQGQVSVSYWKTHAGHKEELRTMHLSKAEEKMVVEKLIAGVPPSRILKDSRKLETPQLDRLAVITTQDLTNLSTKYNIHKKRDQNDMVAAALKVQEWNANNKNYAFLFKKEGQQSPASSESATTARASSVGDHVLSKNLDHSSRNDHMYRSSDEDEMNASPTNDNVMFKEKKDYLNLGFTYDHSPVETTTEL
ncbi:uncharacterized protein LOC126888761 [Diabrotica virgifera virgifera]|uniref:C2H2-type domain-containing protein n=1 Tax=Diabrotica virgifera virgifera TaxID=50390 RepID=A0ABM5KSD7_DIAVI|nr:uncharacterized protein LOC126888761 [Diabrotica virgifera virgifera]